MPQIIAVLDFGSQYTQVIARRLRECQVYSKVYRFDTPVADLRREGVTGIILSGGPSSVFADTAPFPDRGIFEMGVPILGICYGLQLLGNRLGGKVAKSTQREYGRGTLSITEKSLLFKDLPESIIVWNSHGDKLIELPPGFKAIARTENSSFAAIEDRRRRIFGLQFHPEVFHTERGTDILRNFLFDICGCRGDWTMAGYIEMS
ncbi:MAG: glutamine-hydrolyzing GMP synthase, partial [Oceanipulchritudo sp.]